MPTAVAATGAAALFASLGGTILVQLYYAYFTGTALSDECRLSLMNTATNKPVVGATGVCHIYQAFTSSEQVAVLAIGVVLGVIAIVAGALTFRKMPTRRMREQCLAGLFLGIHAITFAVVVFWFRQGEVMIFTRTFLNFEHIDGYYWRYLTIGMKNTLMLAFLGELGGIVIGLVLSILAASQRRVVRAPAAAYINFFRGTPLIWQLVFFYAVFTLGFGLFRGQSFTVAIVVFCLNTGAYAAEVFRAGIQSIEKGQMEAARSLGMNYMQAMRYAIVPQAVRRVIPPLMNEFVVLIKDTALIAVLGLSFHELDIFSLSREGRSVTLNATFMVAAAIGYLIITLPLIAIVNRVEKRLRSGLTGVVGA